VNNKWGRIMAEALLNYFKEKNMKKETTIFNLRLPVEMLKKFRDTCDENYKTCSEALRDLIQDYIKRKNE
jgi:hypothetical protein